MNSSRMSRRLHSSLELLEARIAPAGVTTSFANGVLKITATSLTAAASVLLIQTDADSFNLDNGPATPPSTFDGVKSIIANLSDVDDAFTVIFNNSGNIVFRGAITLNTNSGSNDFVNLTPGKMTGPLTITSAADSFITIDQTQIRGAVKITAPAGALEMRGKAETLTTTDLAFVHLGASADIKGALTINQKLLTPGFNPQVLVDQDSQVGVFTYNCTPNGITSSTLNLNGLIYGKTTVKFGVGANALTTTNTFRAFSGLNVKGLQGPESITINSADPLFTTTIGGPLVLALGDGDNGVNIASTRVAGVTRITTGAGNDQVKVMSSNLGGGLQASLGDTTGGLGNQLFVESVSTIGGALQVTGGPGLDSVMIHQNSSVLGAARVNLGAGPNSFQSVVANFDSGLSYLGLAGDDTFSLGGMSVRGVLSVNLGDGVNQVTVGNMALIHGNTVLKGGNVGTDTFTLQGDSVLNGTLTIHAGNGSNLSLLSNLSNITAFTYNGGADGDTVVLDDLSNPLGEGNGAYVRGKIKLGAGSDSAHVLFDDFISLAIDGGVDGDTLFRIATATVSTLTATNIEGTNIVP